MLHLSGAARRPRGGTELIRGKCTAASVQDGGHGGTRGLALAGRGTGGFTSLGSEQCCRMPRLKTALGLLKALGPGEGQCQAHQLPLQAALSHGISPARGAPTSSRVESESNEPKRDRGSWVAELGRTCQCIALAKQQPCFTLL